MIYVVLYILAGLCDLYSTDRAFKLIPNATEKHPIWSKVFGDRLTRKQLLLSFAIQAPVIISIFTYFQADLRFLLILAGGHLIAAYLNWTGTNKRLK